MSKARAFLTPENEPDGYKTVRLIVPAGDEWEALARGALTALLSEFSWEETGLPVDETVQYWINAMYDTFAWQECEESVGEAWHFYRLEQRANQNTAGGSQTSAIGAQRDLNTLSHGSEDDFLDVDFANRRFTLRNGEYKIDFGATGYKCGLFRSFLVRDGVRVGLGASRRSAAGEADNVESAGSYHAVEDEDGAIYALVSFSSGNQNTDGQGSPSNLLEDELYAYVNIWRKEMTE